MNKQSITGILKQKYIIPLLTSLALTTGGLTTGEAHEETFSGSDAPTLELGELVRLFLLRRDEEPSWFMLAGPNSTITWVTSGIDFSTQSSGGRRHGTTRITVDGRKLVYLRKNIEDVLWDVTLNSVNPPKFGPEYVSIQPGNQCFGSAGSGCDFEIGLTMSNSAISLSKVCEIREAGESVQLYTLNTSERQPAYLLYHATEGSGGGSNWVTLYWKAKHLSRAFNSCLPKSN